MKRTISTEYEVDKSDILEYIRGLDLSEVFELFEWRLRIGNEVDGGAELWDRQNHQATIEAKAAVILKILE
jgi:hypothetical protein